MVILRHEANITRQGIGGFAQDIRNHLRDFRFAIDKGERDRIVKSAHNTVFAAQAGGVIHIHQAKRFASNIKAWIQEA